MLFRNSINCLYQLVFSKRLPKTSRINFLAHNIHSFHFVSWILCSLRKHGRLALSNSCQILTLLCICGLTSSTCDQKVAQSYSKAYASSTKLHKLDFGKTIHCILQKFQGGIGFFFLLRKIFVNEPRMIQHHLNIKDWDLNTPFYKIALATHPRHPAIYFTSFGINCSFFLQVENYWY